MPLLQVRDFPQELYETISRVAQMENRSVPQQTVSLLKAALKNSGDRKERRKAILQEINNLTIKNTDKFPSPEIMVREDRDR